MAKTGRGEADFTAGTRRVIAERAAYRCVVPICNEVTIGPGAAPRQTASTGTACHIHSAAKNGPRGRGGLSDEKLKSAENGVWACATHGRLIDTNAGDAYPATLLHSWKALQEAQLKRERDGLPTRVGWLDAIQADNTVLFKNDSVLRLGKSTLIQGPPFGKTALCDWIATSLGAIPSDRWFSKNSLILTTLTAFVPEKRTIAVRITETGLSVRDNRADCAEIPPTVACIYIREGSRNWSGDEDDDILLGRLFGVDSGVIRRLVPDIQRNGSNWGREFAFYREPRVEGYDEEGDEIYSRDKFEWVLRFGGAKGITIRGLSGSESARLLLEFGAALARERAARMPTVLLLDGSEWPLDPGVMDFYGEFLATQPFQTVMTKVGGWSPADRTCWAEWKRYELRGVKGKAEIVEVLW